MAYPPRICIAGGTYLVTSKCINSEPILQVNDLKTVVLTCISNTRKKYCFEVLAFHIDDTRLTLVVQTKNHMDTISKILQHLKSNITRQINRKIFRTGTIWNERFSSQLIETVRENFLSSMSVFRNLFSSPLMVSPYSYVAEYIRMDLGKKVRAGVMIKE